MSQGENTSTVLGKPAAVVPVLFFDMQYQYWPLGGTQTSFLSLVALTINVRLWTPLGHQPHSMSAKCITIHEK